MTNSKIFLYPGEIGLNFILSLFRTHPATIEPTLYTFLAGMIALVVWSWAIRGCFELVKKAFGFGQVGRYR